MTRLHEDRPHANRVAEVLKLVAHPERLRIVALLRTGEQSVTELAKQLSLKQSVVSQHLRVLRLRSLVRMARRGGFAHYQLNDPDVAALIDLVERCTFQGDAHAPDANRSTET